MNRSTKWMFLALALVTALLLQADMGPKPTAEFVIEYQIEPVPGIVDYALYTCYEPNCSDATRMEQLGPQHFDCTRDACASMAYGYGDYMYITFEFDDGTSRSSNIFTKDHFNAEYRITVTRDDLEVEETGGSNSGSFGWIGFMVLMSYVMMICCGLLILAVIVLVIVLIVRGVRKRQAAEKAGEPDGSPEA